MNIRYIIGSLIISFGILLVISIILMALEITLPENGIEYLGIAWLILAVFTYPFAKKLVRAN